jgi:hypothetical protein
MKAEELVASRSLREAGYVWRVASGEWRAAPRTEGTQQSEAVPLVALAEGVGGQAGWLLPSGKPTAAAIVWEVEEMHSDQ